MTKNVSIGDAPLSSKERVVKLCKSYSNQDFKSHTVLTDDVFKYVSFFYSTHRKTMKYRNSNLESKFGLPNKFRYDFYWEQAEIFYKAAKMMPVEASSVAAYYCMLNAAKSYVSYTSEFVDDFVDQFGNHGLGEGKSDLGENLNTISIYRSQKGVFPLFAKILDTDFSTKWATGKNYPVKLQTLLYNLPFVHRAYSMTYSTSRKSIDELFIPLEYGESPKFYKGSDGKAYLVVDLDKKAFDHKNPAATKTMFSQLPQDFEVYRGFRLISRFGARWYTNGSISTEVKNLSNELRKHFVYIRGSNRLWYIKKSLNTSETINLNTMTINMAAMHRISEIARYKPEQLRRLFESNESWLLHEYITLALDQFLDELASQITHKEIMSVGVKK